MFLVLVGHGCCCYPDWWSQAGVLLGPRVRMACYEGSTPASSLSPSSSSSPSEQRSTRATCLPTWPGGAWGRRGGQVSEQTGRWAETARERGAKPAVCPPTHLLVFPSFPRPLSQALPGRIGGWAAPGGGGGEGEDVGWGAAPWRAESCGFLQKVALRQGTGTT